MEVKANTIIQKESKNNIDGVINTFDEEVLNKIKNSLVFLKNNLPFFTGSVDVGVPGAPNGSDVIRKNEYTNPQAVETNQFNNRNNVPSDKLKIIDEKITADTLWENMAILTKKLNKIRRFRAIWYHTTNDTRIKIDEIDNIGFFENILPDVTPGTDTPSVPDNTYWGSEAKIKSSKYWVRTNSQHPELNPQPSQDLDESKLIEAIDMNESIQNCYNEWKSKCYDNNILTYTMYTCHLNCHSNCHSVRSRR